MSATPSSSSSSTPITTVGAINDEYRERYLVSSDLTVGESLYPIPVYNAVDPVEAERSDRMPKGFVYRSACVDNIEIPNECMVGCSCAPGQCTVENNCPCVSKSVGIELYVDRRVKNIGSLYQSFYTTLLCECSSICTNCCGDGQTETQLCLNRMTPLKPNLRLELHKTPVAGFCVRTQQWIQSGTFIGEFVGELCEENEAEYRKKTEDYSYLIISPDTEEGVGEGEQTRHYVDPSHMGNVTRFFNHSCFPNLIPIRYLSAHRFNHRTSIGFVACRDIPPGSELTIDYGTAWWRGKFDKEGFYCLCDWVYCMRPAPTKPQMSYQNAKKLAVAYVERAHADFLKYRQQERAARAAVASYSRQSTEAAHSSDDSESEEGNEEFTNGAGPSL